MYRFLRAVYGVGGLWSIALVVAGIWQLVQPGGIALRPDRLRDTSFVKGANTRNWFASRVINPYQIIPNWPPTRWPDLLLCTYCWQCIVLESGTPGPLASAGMLFLTLKIALDDGHDYSARWEYNSIWHRQRVRAQCPHDRRIVLVRTPRVQCLSHQEMEAVQKKTKGT